MTPNEKRTRAAIACAVAACLLIALASGAGGLTIGADKDWAQPASDYANTRYSSLKEIKVPSQFVLELILARSPA